MKNVHGIKFHTGTKEELLPEFTQEFPYLASRAELDRYPGHFVPWHWHKTAELFYIESGGLEYYTPKKTFLFPAGSGGMVNSNVLHMTKATAKKTVQLLHIFDVSLLAGEPGSRIAKNYITPLSAASQPEIIPLFPENKTQQNLLRKIVEAFQISSNEFGYEIKLRNALSEIWLLLLKEVSFTNLKEGNSSKTNDKVRSMIVYLHEHYHEKISISDLAAAAYLSERECFRVFHDCLHITPAEYLKNYRLQRACQMLAEDKAPITVVSHSCGLGSSSYFGKVFRDSMHCTPLEYRRKWQDSAIFRQK